MTREIAVQHARRNIRCNALLPGPIGTPLTAQLFDTPEKLERRRVHMPMGRFGKAVEVAEVALFLCSDAASYRSEEHTSQLQSLMRISYAVFCLKKKTTTTTHQNTKPTNHQ